LENFCENFVDVPHFEPEIIQISGIYAPNCVRQRGFRRKSENFFSTSFFRQDFGQVKFFSHFPPNTADPGQLFA
jgi:hypothetical protein